MRNGMNNRKRLKKLVLANKETRCLYRMMQFLAIFMVVSCLVIITLAKWIEYDQNKKREELFGSWDEVFLNVDKEDLNYFRKNAFLEQISVQSIQEKVFLEGDQRVVIGACDENFLEMGNIQLLEGRMPEHEKEVAVEEEYLEVLGVSGVGDVVSENSKVESLEGHKVTGVIGDYSRLWKLVNNDIKYINCFIKTSDNNELNIYVTYNGWSKRDLEINLIEYRENISNIQLNDRRIIVKLLSVAVFSMVLVFIRIRNKIKGIMYTINNKVKRTFRINYEIIVIILEFITVFYTTRVFVELAHPLDYVSNSIECMFPDGLQQIIMRNGITIYEFGESLTLHQTKAIFLSILGYFVDEFANIIMLIVLNILSVFMQHQKYNSEIEKNIDFYSMSIYFNNRSMIFELVSKDRIKLFILNTFFILFWCALILNVYIEVDFKVLVLNILVQLVVFLIRNLFCYTNLYFMLLRRLRDL